MAVSVFGNRRPLRSILPATSTFQVAKEVRTEDELRQALQPLDTLTNSTVVANTGRRIVITAPITLHSPIIIDESLPGTIIEANGYLPIICGVDGIDAFEVRAFLCTISGLLFTSTVLSGAATLGQFATCVRVKANNGFCRILDCHVLDCESLAVIEVFAGDGVIRGCRVGSPTNTSNADCVTMDGDGWRIEGNWLAAAGIGVAVRITANGEYTAIVGNNLANDGAVSSASLGNNTIFGNTRAGVITNHATDAVGLNT
jgi:hypothetical protein